jgi:hypothetical protein
MPDPTDLPPGAQPDPDDRRDVIDADRDVVDPAEFPPADEPQDEVPG